MIKKMPVLANCSVRLVLLKCSAICEDSFRSSFDCLITVNG